MPGTGTPNANIVADYSENFRDYYIAPANPSCTATSAPACDLVGIDYFASFWPLVILSGWCVPGRCEKFDVSVAEGVENLDSALTTLLDNGYTDDIIIAGYSQGARVATVEKINLASGAHGDLTDQVTFTFIGNTNRGNGGLLSRLGILGHIPILDVTTGQPTPIDTGYVTTDYSIRWEGIADSPLYLANPLAWTNSILGFWYDHGTYLAVNQNSDPGELPGEWPVDQWQDFIDNPQNYPDIVDVQTDGDTTFYTITPQVLPIVRPLHMVPLVGPTIANLIEPALRVVIEQTGYDRSLSFGQYAPLRLIPIFNPITLALDLVPAIVEGIENAFGGGGSMVVAPSDNNVSAFSAQSFDSEDATDVQESDADGDESVADGLSTDTTAGDNDGSTTDDATVDEDEATADADEATVDEDATADDDDATADEADETTVDEDDADDANNDAADSNDTDNEQAAA